MQLRLTTGSDYRDDLAALRDAIRENGTRATRQSVDVVIGDDPGAPRVSLLRNLAWQAAKNGPAVDASLYTLGFVSQGGTAFVFDIRPFPGGTPAGAGPGQTVAKVVDGPYANPWFWITDITSA
ncbi:hypothetical protein [Burkholderia sp. Nafp2/4-1b]|uniref:hypothetical protein n=1 Tax=Burkholderia sp. Nafp2/4-1b TaxID=2116686 RepID=UPI001F0894D3|nr:hypothetical protein [Burkholderia sp. Nafp2/4-1b]